MQAPNAQGIMGLMAQGRAPQGAPQGMPSPMKASPMAGLGSVEDRVSAYRGNPAPLQQRYQMSQDLLDLLALQKIKSEKDAAARQMQLAMGQQQQAQGMEPQTVAQQREKEVHDLTKAELAQQRGETAQQQVSQQQDALKRAMSGGVAAAPGAAAAAQPKAMAAGGIVAFAGPTDGSMVPDLQEKNPEFDEDGNPRPRVERERIMAQNARIREMKGNAQDLGGMRERRVAGLQTANAGLPEIMDQFYKPRRPDVTSAAQAVTTQGAQPQATPPTPAPAAPGAPVAAPAPTPGAVPRPPAPAPAPGAAPQAGLPALAGRGNELWDMSKKLAGQDVAGAREAEEGRIEKKLGIDPAHQRAMEEANAFRKREFDTQYDPERQRQEGLIRFLTGAGGRRYGELGAGAQAGMAYDAGQRAAKLKEFEDMQKGIMEPFNLKRKVTEEGIKAGQEAGKQTGEGQRAGLASLYHTYGTDVGSRDKALDREVERLKINLQADTNKLQREGLDLSKAQSIYSAATGRVQELERKLDADFAKNNGMLLMAEQNGKMEAAQKQQLEVARAQLELQKDKIRKELEPVLSSARAKLGITSTQGWGELNTKTK